MRQPLYQFYITLHNKLLSHFRFVSQGESHGLEVDRIEVTRSTRTLALHQRNESGMDGFRSMSSIFLSDPRREL